MTYYLLCCGLYPLMLWNIFFSQGDNTGHLLFIIKLISLVILISGLVLGNVASTYVGFSLTRMFGIEGYVNNVARGLGIEGIQPGAPPWRHSPPRGFRQGTSVPYPFGGPQTGNGGPSQNLGDGNSARGQAGFPWLNQPTTQSYSQLPPYQTHLSGPIEVRVKNPNNFRVTVGLRSEGDGGKDFDVPANGTQSAYVPNGNYDIYFVYSNEPNGLYQGNRFTLSNRGVEIQIVKVVGGNYGIRKVK